MKRLNLYCMALAVLAMGSCSLEHESIVPEEIPGMKFTAVWSDEASRTSLAENGTSVLWDPGDEIFVFQGVTAQGPSAMGKFKSTNAARQASATFTGTLEGECSGDYIAVYPYYPFHEQGTAMDGSEYGYGSVVMHVITPVQQGVEGSFALKTAPAAAVSSTNELVFHNICGGVRFSVTRSGIKKVSFSSVDGSPMSGMAYIIIGDDGLPMAMMGGPEEMGGKAQSFVDVIAPEGGFVPGKNYYAMMAPQAHAEGIKITLYSDDGMAEKTLSGPITVKRSVFGKLDNIDSGLGFARTTPVPEIVDLGLSVKWASCNLGASAPEGYGDYYAWGETAPKAEYTGYNYKWLVNAYFALKYTLSPSISNVDPTPDNKLVLDSEDDAAAVNLGGSWRMPTAEEFEELASGCTWTEETVNGIKGMRATSKVSGYTDQSIFIPYAGGKDDQNSGVDFSSENYIWSSSNLQYPDTESYYAGIVCTAFSFYSWGQFNYFGFRYWGLPVRPVYAGEVVHVTGVELNESSLQLRIGAAAQLFATVSPGDASSKRVMWSSSDDSVATVSEEGVVSGVGVGTAEIMVTTMDGGFAAKCIITVTYPDLTELGKTFVPVDLGLPSGLKWASFNLGATKPEGYGSYYAWGETEPKADYSWSTYKWCKGSYNTMTKYCNESNYGYNGFTDNKTVLAPEDDAAAVNLGGSWRMPTKAEQDELRSQCTWTWTTNYNGTGVNGSLVTGLNGNSIFLPAAGYRNGTSLNFAGSLGYFWSSSLNAGRPYGAYRVYFDSGDVGWYYDSRYYGQSVRPVYAGEVVHVTGVELNESSLQLERGATAQLIATITPEDASNKRVLWSSSDESIATVSEEGVVSGVGVGTAVITATTVDGGLTAKCTIEVNYHCETPEMVDLGLSVKWASFNLGASAPEEYGDYFAWGETEPKADYSWSTYKWCNGSENTLTKYCTNSSYGYNGFTDNKTVLDPEDDAAAVNWGGKWRMPTKAEQNELRSQCTWTWTTNYNGTGVKGRLVTGPNGNSIFLPAARYRIGTSLSSAGSYGDYWSSSLSTGVQLDASIVYFSSGIVNWYNYSRYYGLSVRPVCN